MQSSPTRLKKPLHIWLARILGIGIVLINIGTNLAALPEAWQKIQHEGVSQDVYSTLQSDGSFVVVYVSPEVAQKGIAIGDRAGAESMDPKGEIGSLFTIRVQKADSTIREVAVERKPADYRVWGAMLFGLPQQTGAVLSLLFVLVPFIMGAIAALLLCWLKSDDWMALLTAILLSNVTVFPSTNPSVVIFGVLISPLILSWLFLFPNGKLAPRWSWVLVLFTWPVDLYYSLFSLGILTYNTTLPFTVFSVLGAIGGLGIVGVIIFRFWRLFTPTERQQTKWVILPFLLFVIPSILLNQLSTHYWNSYQVPQAQRVDFLNSALSSAGNCLLVLGILFSIFRYRLYDVDTFISRAIVYGSLTAILTLVGALVVPLINYMLEQSVGDQSNLLAVLVGALPIAALFRPVRDGLQHAVDRRFKPEEMDFENTFIEFTSELRSLFTTRELSTLLARHAVEQLDIAQASVFLHGGDGQLKHVTTICAEQGTPDPQLDEKTIEKLKKGQLTSPDGDYEQSMVVPLVVPRSRKPSLLGALFLGPRLQGVGYSTPMVKSLKKFGEQVGKAFYVAEMKSKQRQTLMENE